MAILFQPVTLATGTPDRDGMLVYRDGNLFAVLSRLSDIHTDLEGHLFVEAVFGRVPKRLLHTFETLEQFEEWLITSD